MSEFAYRGGELEVFRHALNWKTYFRDQLRPYMKGEVLEVGAGIGATTPVLAEGSPARWTCLEPAPRLAERIRSEVAPKLPGCRVITGSIRDLDERERFDCILYIDVLEHIEDDRGELAGAALHLRPGGTLCVVAPAHQWLFTPFDQAVGHHRRYSRRTLRAAAGSLRELKLIYLDSVGLAASLANRLLLRSAHPSLRQILFWDRVLVPLSRPLDRLLGHTLGKSVLGIWQKPA